MRKRKKKGEPNLDVQTMSESDLDDLKTYAAAVSEQQGWFSFHISRSHYWDRLSGRMGNYTEEGEESVQYWEPVFGVSKKPDSRNGKGYEYPYTRTIVILSLVSKENPRKAI